jgi:predicted esterase YcpF (UPF0227 family)
VSCRVLLGGYWGNKLGELFVLRGW